MTIQYLETPALVADLDAMERNVKKITDMLADTPMALRAHYKSFKCPALAHWLEAHGAKGFVCAKLSEAEDLAMAGIEDILIGNQVTVPSKIARVAYLANCCRLTVCVDNAENVRLLDRACALEGSKLHVLVEYDIGMKRCGVFSEEDFIALAKEIDACRNLIFDGIQAYAGNLSHEENYEIRKRESAVIEKRLLSLKEALENAGIQVATVSGISTGTVEFHGRDSVYTEVQAGSFLFSDAAYQDVGTVFEQALYLLTTVISRRENAIIMDAGAKSLGMDQKKPYFREYPEVPVEFSEEHTALYIPSDKQMGDKLFIVPGHCCTTINLHDRLFLFRGNKIVDCLMITGRGKSL